MLSLILKPSAIEKIQRGYPWVYSHDMVSPLHKHTLGSFVPGSLVRWIDSKQHFVALGYYNPLSTLSGRVLSLINRPIDDTFFTQCFQQALSRRERFFDKPYYRLIHAESDQLPGLIIDRFDDTFVCQSNTAGMEQLKPIWLNVLQTLFSPRRIICKDNAPLRTKEGLSLTIYAPLGNLEEPVQVLENGLTFLGEPCGQKTGWYYDHRLNRAWVAERAKNQRVLDLYTYHGGFGLLAAAQGAKHVTLVDRSESALQLTEKTAQQLHLTQCEMIQADVFDYLEKHMASQEPFDVVIADPPAFVKLAKDQGAGLRGYQKLARLASQWVAPNGLLFIASCSHHASSADFRQAVEAGLQKSQRPFRLLRKAGAGPDHPIHPFLPQTHYLKSLAYRFD